MKDLIKVNDNRVDARELHKTLESKQKFADWVKNKLIKKFKAGRDYLTIRKVTKRKEGVRGANVATDYSLTIDVAKHLALMENTDKGFEVREYFIECERLLYDEEFMTKDRFYQRAHMDTLNGMLPEVIQKETSHYRKANIVTNKAVSSAFGFPKSIKKAEMPKDMLILREEILSDYLTLYKLLDGSEGVKEILYKKYSKLD